MRTKTMTATVGVVTVVLSGAVVAGTSGAQAADQGRQLTGTWKVLVDPDAAPDGSGDAPPFASTIAYTATGSVIEATSRAPMSAGLGSWERLGGAQFTSVVEKYRFTPAGAPAGTIRIVEVQTVAPDGESYTGRATTTFLRADGSVERSFGATVQASRLEA